jgi:hypothetical protein
MHYIKIRKYYTYTYCIMKELGMEREEEKTKKHLHSWKIFRNIK